MFMRRKSIQNFLSSLFLSLMILNGLSQGAAFSQSSPQSDPNAELPVEMLQIKTSGGEYTFSVEVADDPLKRQKGLMFRETMVPTHGMIFDFQALRPIAMWMKNTPLSIDMLFIRPDGTISKIAKNTVPYSEDVIASDEPISHVLELNAGISTQLGLKRDDVIKHRFFNNAD